MFETKTEKARRQTAKECERIMRDAVERVAKECYSIYETANRRALEHYAARNLKLALMKRGLLSNQDEVNVIIFKQK